MIDKDTFVEMITLAEKFEAEVDRWHDFDLDVFDKPIVEIPWDMFSLWKSREFDANGIDWIAWYLWERKDWKTKEILACYDEDGNPFYVKTPEDLWDIVKEYRLETCPNKESTICLHS